MEWASRWLRVSMIGLCGCALAGCLETLPKQYWPQESPAGDISNPGGPSSVRAQTLEMQPPVSMQKPTPLAGIIGPPPPLTDSPNIIAPPPPLPGTGGPVIQTSNTTKTRGTVRLAVRAWVNGLPIFDDEVRQGAGMELAKVERLPEPQRSQEYEKVTKTVLENIIDSEVMYQEAMKKIKSGAPHMLDKLKEVVEHEYDKNVQKMRKMEPPVPEDIIRQLESVSKRMLERNLISTEYARSRILDYVKAIVSLQMIRDYYDLNKNEFTTVDKVVWQDIFIPTSRNHPTVNDVKRFAEELINRCRQPDDFVRLMVYNDGDSKLRNGEGMGTRRGEIQPRELEPYLFQLGEGQIGPVVPIFAGVHIFRVVKREYAGQLPLNDEIQKSIRKKLENQLADREYRRIIRELRARAIIRYEHVAP